MEGFDKTTIVQAADDLFNDIDMDDFDEFDDFAQTSGQSMEERIKQAKLEGEDRIPVPDEMVSFVKKQAGEYDEDVEDVTLEDLGLKKELNPFGNDETERRKRVRVIHNAMSCSACGVDFQCQNEDRPGYLPPAKFEVQTNLSKIEAMQELQAKAASEEWTSRDELEFLIQTASNTAKTTVDNKGVVDIDIEAMAAEMNLDLEVLSRKKTICKRCHGLQHSGKVDDKLRPGWTDEPTLSQQQFRDLLRPIGQKPAVIIALVDLFDFGGSVLRELDGIAGENPVILAANKVDLLPKKMGAHRVDNWVRRELEYMGVKSLANVGGAVRLVSCKNGWGVFAMLDKARELAKEKECDVYIVGAANAGKSTLINYILRRNTPQPDKKVRKGNKNSFKGALTTSPLPGTTLKFIKIDLGDGTYLYDTPGLLVPGTMTQMLTPNELKVVCPTKPVEPVTFRVSAGKCVMIGGLARVEVIGDSKPFLLTFFVANGIKLHPTDSERVDNLLQNHVGDWLTPPSSPERLMELGEFDTHILDIEGDGWRQAAADISLTGLGWVAVTGVGSVKLKISVPKGIGVAVRPPLMPFDIWEVASRYTGSKAVRKVGRTKYGRRRKGVGRN
eukprot:Nitzschia sp. Nitz4//scaffold58_size112336//20502//22410//NITZ4_004019-RA/size112336-augustus-gene-0.17-mRNA-1//-1//CDS//3329554947//5421//frame0